jgi:hypothetical protein
MATVVLGAAGSAIGASIGGSLLGATSAAWGRAIGASIGGLVDQRLAGTQNHLVENGKIESFRLQSGIEGAPIGRAFGRNRLAGQVIWASEFYEAKSATTQGGGKFNTQPTVTTESYVYSVSLALALCEGEILKVGRVWADGVEISKSDLPMTVYTGSSDQEPDATIAGVEGVAQTPAFRNTAYVVFDELQITQFGNRVPQFNFEVFRQATPENVEIEPLNDLINGVALMPGSGEYVLATSPVNYSNEFGSNQSANVHTNRGGTDVEHALEDLRQELPNSDSVLLVASWFGDDLRCSDCQIVPKVEQAEIEGAEMPWTVSGQPRGQASIVSQEDDRPVFGGTPCDQSILEGIAEITSNGQEVVFYPFIMMDIQKDNGLADPWGNGAEQPVIPWRGRITGSIAPGGTGTPDKTAAMRAEVNAFFGAATVTDFSQTELGIDYSGPVEWSYRRFILHYAHLCAKAGGVSAFCLGSEMRGLTSLRDENNLFPAVEELIALAQDVRAILGPEVKIGYAADWSEYFGYQPSDGSGDLFFNLDGLWADSNVDFVGIDNYMPLSDWRDQVDHLDADWGEIYNQNYLKANIEGGEGYEWYYANSQDRDMQVRTPITDGAYDEPWVYRYKDIRNWWSNWHFNRVGGVREEVPTLWKPEAKPIWFTELGFPAVDKGTNQPNVFIDPKSSESASPYYSNLEQDPEIQQSGLRAVLEYWRDDENNPASSLYDGKMIDTARTHIWAWDARPWPDFPLRQEVWSDGENYELGHWLSGRVGGDQLARIVAEICECAGIETYDVSGLNKVVNGFWIKGGTTGREAMQTLMGVYAFDCIETEGVMVFRATDAMNVRTVDKGQLVETEDELFSVSRNSDDAKIDHVSLGFWNSDQNYQFSQVEARQADKVMPSLMRLEFPLVLRNSEASIIVQKILFDQNSGRERVSFKVPVSQIELTVGDIVSVESLGLAGRFKIETIEEHSYRIVEAARVVPTTSLKASVENSTSALPDVIVANPLYARFLDLPVMKAGDNTVAPFVAVTADPWPGGAVIYTSKDSENFELDHSLFRPSILGRTLTALEDANAHRWSEATIVVKVSGGELSSVSENSLLSGQNLAAIRAGMGDEWELFQYQYATLDANGDYVLSRFLRGQFGTDAVKPDIHPIGSEIVFLGDNIGQLVAAESDFGDERTVRYGDVNLPISDENFTNETISFNGIGLRPFSPVHLRERHVSSGDILFKWTRRTRALGDFWAANEVPLNETSEAYNVSISQNGIVLRTEATDQPLFIYTLADQVADGAVGEVTVSVSQSSEIYGLGPATRMNINV